MGHLAASRAWAHPTPPSPSPQDEHAYMMRLQARSTRPWVPPLVSSDVL